MDEFRLRLNKCKNGFNGVKIGEFREQQMGNICKLLVFTCG